MILLKIYQKDTQSIYSSRYPKIYSWSKTRKLLISGLWYWSPHKSLYPAALSYDSTGLLWGKLSATALWSLALMLPIILYYVPLIPMHEIKLLGLSVSWVTSLLLLTGIVDHVTNHPFLMSSSHRDKLMVYFYEFIYHIIITQISKYVFRKSLCIIFSLIFYIV